ncbi:MAG: PilZ domain-containing protein [Desulfuromonadaceae bacterium]
MDNRNFTRVNCSVKASVRYGIEVVDCNTDNVSLHGMHLKTDHDIPLNIPLNVTVFHANQISLKVNAKAVRKEANGVGLQINNLNVNSFVQLRNLVTEHCSDKGAVMQETFKMLKCIY